MLNIAETVAFKWWRTEGPGSRLRRWHGSKDWRFPVLIPLLTVDMERRLVQALSEFAFAYLSAHSWVALSYTWDEMRHHRIGRIKFDIAFLLIVNMSYTISSKAYVRRLSSPHFKVP